MSRILITIVLSLGAIVGLAMGPTTAAADWSTDPFVNDHLVDLPTGAEIRDLVGVPDGEGGVLMAWLQRATDTSPWNAFAHRLDAAGDAVWPEPLELRLSATDVRDLTAIGAGDGGMYVAMTDVAPGGRSVFVQFIDGSFDVQWNEGGVEVAPGIQQIAAEDPVLADMGADGVLVAWEDTGGTSDGRDIWAQRLTLPFGGRAWGTTGLEICGAAGIQEDVVASGAQGRAYIAWSDRRDSDTFDTDVYMQSVTAEWTDWATDGVLVHGTTSIDQNPSLAPDGAGGVWIAWQTSSTDPTTVRLARWTAEAEELFARALTNDATLPQFDPHVMAHPVYGAVVVWTDYIGYGGPLRAQRLTPSGYRPWGVEAVALLAIDGGQDLRGMNLADDGSPTFLIAQNWELFSQRLDAAGSPVFGPDGLMVSVAAPDWYGGDVFVPSGNGHLAAWFDSRELDGPNIYGAHIDGWGYLGEPTPTVVAVDDYPQDQGGIVRLDWQRSYLDDPVHGDVLRYTLWRRLADTALRGVSPSDLADRAATLAGTTRLPQTKVADLLTAGWAYVDEQPAYFQDVYAYHAPTYGDSTSAGTIITEYKVIAHTDQPTPFWESNLGAGYSVDNLAPPAVAALAAAREPDAAVALAWDPVAAPDLQLYRVYRAIGAEVQPVPEALIAATTDTIFVDTEAPADQPLAYVVAAVDVHENQGSASNVATVTGNATDAADLPVAVAELAITGATPNPFNPVTTISFALDRSGPIRLQIFDARGRRVATLVDGPRPAGEHAVVWRGRDAWGQAVASGVYLARLEAGDAAAARKLLLAR